MTETEGSPKLLCGFDYHQTPIKHEVNGQIFTQTTNQFVITPYTVRQVIEYALSTGWKPFEKGRDLTIADMDDKIDLRLDRNRANNFKKPEIKK
jgi:hypothetical protein